MTRAIFSIESTISFESVKTFQTCGPMKSHLTPRQLALALGVSESSIKRWADQGRIPAERTPGGHRRLPVAGVLHFLRRTRQPVERPEFLQLPRRLARGVEAEERALERARTEGAARLAAGDEEALRGATFALYLGGLSAAVLADRVFAPAFHRLGELWAEGRVDVYQERRGCEIATRVLHELLLAVPPSPPGAPLAIGGTLAGDPYTLPTTMVELALREAGWRARSLGSGHPVETLERAIGAERPRLVWLSVSSFTTHAGLAAEVGRLHAAAAAGDAVLVVGGRALTAGVRERLVDVAYGADLAELLAFAAPLVPGGGTSEVPA